MQGMERWDEVVREEGALLYLPKILECQEVDLATTS